ncbi:MAG: xanthine dehydrogenase subunit XdhC [Eubacteriales bacterium]
MEQTITFTINDEERTMNIKPGQSLLELIREDLGLTGAKQGCGVGECGACAVLVDGQAIDSCIYLAAWADGKNIVTIEGLSKNGELTNMQKAFVEGGAVQCGFCTPGIIMTATEMEAQDKNYTEADIKRALSGHLCRCTGYTKIVEATQKGLEDAGKCSCGHDKKEV